MALKRRLLPFIRLAKNRWFYFVFVGFCCLLYLRSHREKVHRYERIVQNVHDDALPTRRKLAIFQKGELGNYEPTVVETKEGPGENGAGVNIADHEAVSKADQEYGFNTLASDKISLDRAVPDTRPEECKYWHYPRQLPKASVVIVFHNEGWSPLMRTVHSVVNRSPPDLLEEVLLVDDYSVKAHLKDRLENYIKRFKGTVRLIRNSKREGLIGSRSIGAQNAKGEVVVFLDAHCEANANWLPPLLTPIAADRKTMTVPVIDSIDMNTWAYHPQYGYRGIELFRGIFEWGLLYKESELPEQEKKGREHDTEPFRSPTHAGGLFAIDKQWFADLGYYDSGLQIWGGENFELSFKVWMCGGSIENVPCSRVGHVYRNHMPYTFGNLTGPIISTNYKRVAEVWMDEYKEYYYRREPFMRDRPMGDISKQLKIREANKCKSFRWFMENVAYDVPSQYPLLAPLVGWGEFKNEATGQCIDTMGHSVPGILGVSSCHHSGGNQLFRLGTRGRFACGEWCIVERGVRLETGRCQKSARDDGPWDFIEKSQQIRNKRNGRCVSLIKKEPGKLVLNKCDASDQNQKWIINANTDMMDDE